MSEISKLLENFWITRSYDRAEYFSIKRMIDNDIKQFFSSFAGWKLIINNKLIKLEKIPAVARASMGIQDFESTNDYCLLCAVLIYLDDKTEGEQFLLSELIENIEKIISGTVDMDFTRFTDRKSLVRMLKFAQEMQLLKISEGSLERVESNREKEILYENTGLSRYFSIHHDNDISGYENYRDFETCDNSYSDKDKGYLRSNRVYRKLLLEPAIYWNSKDDADSLYIKNQRNTISARLDRYLDGRLDVHNGAAFYMVNEDETFGTVHPSDKMISGFTALICGKLRDKLNESVENSNFRYMKKDDFNLFIIDCKQEFIDGLSKEFREMPDDKLTKNVTEYMTDWLLIEESDESYFICDGAFKICGRYPSDFYKEDK